MLKKFGLFLLVSLLLFGCSSSNEAGNTSSDEFPDGNITLIVPFAPGGGTDTAARILAQSVQEQLGSTVVVKNVAGGGGAVGASELMNAKPDGYTIAVVPQSTIAIQPQYGNVAYDYDSFEPILQAITMPQGLFVKNDAPWETAEEWLEYVKENPGQFKYGTSGHGGEQHLTMLDLDHKAGTESEHIPYVSGTESITALAGGHIEGAVAFPKIADPKQLRLLLSFGEERNADFPDVPTAKELGIDTAMDVFFGIIAPKGVPEDRIKVLHDAFQKALDDPELIEKINEQGYVVDYTNAADYQKRIEESYNNFKEIIERTGIE